MAGDFDDFDDLSDLTDGLDEDSSNLNNIDGSLNKRKVAIAISKSALTTAIAKDNLRPMVNAILEDSRALPRGYAPVLNDILTGYDVLGEEISKTGKALAAPVKTVKKLIHTKVDSLSFLPAKLRDTIKAKTAADEDEDDVVQTAAVAPTQGEIDQATLSSIFGNELDKAKVKKDNLIDDLNIKINTKQAELSKDSAISLRRLVGYQNTVNFKYQRKSLEAQLTQVALTKEILNITKAASKDTVDSLRAIVNNTGLPDSLKLSLAEGVAKERSESIYGAGNKLLGGAITPLLQKITDKISITLANTVKTTNGISSATGSISDAGGQISDLSNEERMAVIGNTIGGGLSKLAARGAGRLFRRSFDNSVAGQTTGNKILFNLENPQQLSETVREKLTNMTGDSYFSKGVRELLRKNVTNKRIEAGVEEGDFAGLTKSTSYGMQEKKTINEIIPALLAKQLRVLESINGEDKDELAYDFRFNRFSTKDKMAKLAKAEVAGDFANRQERLVGAVTKAYRLKTKVELSAEAETALREFIVQAAISGRILKMEDLNKAIMSKEPAVQEELVSYFSQKLGDTSGVNLSVGRIFKDMRTGYDDIQNKLNQFAGTFQHAALQDSGILDDTFKFKHNQLDQGELFKEQNRRYAARMKRVRDETVNIGDGKNFAAAVDVTDSTAPDPLRKKSKGKYERTKIYQSTGVGNLFRRYRKGKYTESYAKAGELTSGEAAVATQEPTLEVSPPVVETETPQQVDTKPKVKVQVKKPTVEPVISTTPVTPIQSVKPIVPETKPVTPEAVATKPEVVTPEKVAETKPNEEPVKSYKIYDRVLPTIDKTIVDAKLSVKEKLRLIREKQGDVTQSIKTNVGDKVNEVVNKVSQPIYNYVESNKPQAYKEKPFSETVKSKIEQGKEKLYGYTPNVSISNIVKDAKDKIASLADTDVFTKGDDKPILTKQGINDGDYTDSVTGKIIKTVWDIKGDIKDRLGNVVVKASELKDGLFTSKGEPIQGNSTIIRNAKQSISDSKNEDRPAIPTSVNDIKSMAAEHAKRAYTSFTNSADIYVSGETTPRMTAVNMDNGHYALNSNGKPVLTVADITGPVVDKTGAVVLSKVDIESGLYDKNGKRISTNFMMRAMSKIAKGTLNLGIKALKFQVNYAKWVLRTTGKIVTGKLFSGGAEDIYVRGDPVVRLTKAKMERGDYVLTETGKHIFTVSEISGPISDVDGNALLVEDDFKRGLYYKNGRKVLVNKVMGFIRKIGRGVNAATIGLVKSAYKGTVGVSIGYLKLLGKTIAKAAPTGMFSAKGEDVYVFGEEEPRLTSALMDRGEYMLLSNGKYVFTIKDITGPLVDHTGNVVLTSEDIKKGLYDKNGKKLIIGGKFGMLKRMVAGITGGVKSLVSLPGKALGGIKNLTTKIGLKGQTPGNLAQEVEETITETEERLSSKIDKSAKEDAERDKGEYDRKLYELMKEDISGSKRKYNDSDGDGERDGGWRSLLKRKKKVKDPLAKKEKSEEKEDKTNPILAILGAIAGTLFAFPGKILGGLASGLGKLGKIFTSGLANLLKGLLAGKALSGGGVDLPDYDKNGKKIKKAPTGKRGLFRRGLDAIKSGGSKVWNGAKSIGRKVPVRATLAGARSVAGFGIKKAAAAGAGAVAVAAGAPVIATGAAIAGAAYTVYEAFNFFYDRRSPSGWDKLRYLQYGINTEDGFSVSKIRELEEEMEDHITLRSGVPIFDMELKDAVEEFGEDIFDVDEEDVEAKRAFAIWFGNRFLPVYMRWFDTLNKVAPRLPIEDADDLKGEQITKMLDGVGLSITRMSPNPFSITDSPFSDTMIFSNKDLIVAQIRILSNGAPVSGTDTNLVLQAKQASSEMAAKDKAGVIGQRAMNSALQGTKTVAKTPTVERFAGKVVSPVAKSVPVPISQSVPVSYTPSADGKFNPIMPISGNHRISSPYGERIHPIHKTKKFHHGIDIAAPNGTPVLATEKGTIYRLYVSSSYGKVIYIKHENGMGSRYAHMSNFAKTAHNGKEVQKGEVIGYVGNTGQSAGNHLHFEFRKDLAQFAKSIDPLSLIKGTYKKDIATEEKEIKAGNAAESKVVKDNIEGLDTVASTVEVKSGVVNKPSPTIPSPTPVNKSNSVAYKPKGNVVVSEESVSERPTATPMSNSTIKELSASFIKQNTANDKAYAQRETMILSLGTINKTLVSILNDSSATNKHLASVSGSMSNQVKDQKTTKSFNGQRSISPVVDLS
jgi:murein DD-endopeptidase MepM/ murein hydrolase activator NlpD